MSIKKSVIYGACPICRRWIRVRDDGTLLPHGGGLWRTHRHQRPVATRHDVRDIPRHRRAIELGVATDASSDGTRTPPRVYDATMMRAGDHTETRPSAALATLNTNWTLGTLRDAAGSLGVRIVVEPYTRGNTSQRMHSLWVDPLSDGPPDYTTLSEEAARAFLRGIAHARYDDAIREIERNRARKA